MTDIEKTTETATKKTSTEKAKPKSKAKPKAKPKAKAITKTKPAAKSKESPEDTAPQLKKASKPEVSQVEPPKRKFKTLLPFLLAVVIIIPITIYKFNEELNNMSVEPKTQENTVSIEDSPSAATQIASDINITDTQPAQTPETGTSYNKTVEQRRQDYENEITANKQRYQTGVETRHQERIKAAGVQIEKFKRIRQKQLETKIKAQQIREQINELHEQLHQLMQEYNTVNRSQ